MSTATNRCDHCAHYRQTQPAEIITRTWRMIPPDGTPPEVSTHHEPSRRQCRRYAPRVFKGGAWDTPRFQTWWPQTTGEQRCGEFKAATVDGPVAVAGVSAELFQ